MFFHKYITRVKHGNCILNVLQECSITISSLPNMINTINDIIFTSSSEYTLKYNCIILQRYNFN